MQLNIAQTVHVCVFSLLYVLVWAAENFMQLTMINETDCISCGRIYPLSLFFSAMLINVIHLLLRDRENFILSATHSSLKCPKKRTVIRCDYAVTVHTLTLLFAVLYSFPYFFKQFYSVSSTSLVAMVTAVGLRADIKKHGVGLSYHNIRCILPDRKPE